MIFNLFLDSNFNEAVIIKQNITFHEIALDSHTRQKS